MSSAGPGGSRGALTVDRAVCAGERRSVRPLAAAPRNHARGCLPTGLSSEEAVMKYALASRTDTPADGVIAGIDWASADHAVCIVDAAGEVVSRFSIEHTAVEAPVPGAAAGQCQGDRGG